MLKNNRSRVIALAAAVGLVSASLVGCDSLEGLSSTTPAGHVQPEKKDKGSDDSADNNGAEDSEGTDSGKDDSGKDDSGKDDSTKGGSDGDKDPGSGDSNSDGKHHPGDGENTTYELYSHWFITLEDGANSLEVVSKIQDSAKVLFPNKDAKIDVETTSAGLKVVSSEFLHKSQYDDANKYFLTIPGVSGVYGDVSQVQ